jgi:2-polyprenyl-3-methyl-5-hydroxy-6-metoxy-1,4-benzoquinol methylase
VPTCFRENMMVRKADKMKLSYTEIFKYSEILNPISPVTLFLAGELAQLGPRKTVLDLGSGKGFPSLLWASIFGIRVEGFDLNKNYVSYANSRAKMLNLSHRVKYSCEDIKELRLGRKYDMIAFLGLGMAHVYGSNADALRVFKTMLHKNGILVLAEPIWLVKPVSSRVLEALSETEDSFLTMSEMQELLRKSEFQELGNFISSKEDWEIYVRPIYIAMQEIIESESKLAEEAQKIMNGFRAEFDAVGKDWNMVLWVAKSQ